MPHCVRRVTGTELPQGGTGARQFSVHVYCGQTAGSITILIGTDVGLGPGDNVLRGDPSPERGTAAPKFWPMSFVTPVTLKQPNADLMEMLTIFDSTYSTQSAERDPSHTHLHSGRRLPLLFRRSRYAIGPLSCLSLTLVHCGQTVAWTKMLLDKEVGLRAGDIVLDGDTAPPKRGTAPNFWPMCVVAKRLDGSRCHLYAGTPRSRRHCVRWGT